MPIQILINILIAFLWMFFQDTWNVLSFIGGYLVGIVILLFTRRFFNQPIYLLFVYAVIKLFLVFIRELLESAVFVMRKILSPKLNLTPGIFRLETDLESDIEITLISMLITLTPGSVVMEISPDRKHLYVHALDLPESKIAVEKSQKAFEKAIKDVTRTYV